LGRGHRSRLAVAHRVRQAREMSIFHQTHPHPEPNALGIRSPSLEMMHLGEHVTHSFFLSMKEVERKRLLKSVAKTRLRNRPLRLKSLALIRKNEELPQYLKIAHKRLRMEVRVADRQSMLHMTRELYYFDEYIWTGGDDALLDADN